MNENYSTDTQLLDALRVNDTRAFETLFERHWFPLYKYAYLKLGSEEDAAAITRDIFIHLWEYRMIVPAEFSLQAFLYRQLRKDVVSRLYDRICNEPGSVFSQELEQGFSLEHLRSAYRPVPGLAVKQVIPDAAHRQPTLIGHYRERIMNFWQAGIRILQRDIPLVLRKTFF